MKKFIIGMIALFICCLAVAWGAKTATQTRTDELAAIVDRYNPLVKKKEVYVKIKQPDNVNEHGIAHYKQTVVDASGQTRPLEFNGMQVLKVNHYLKISTKGAYVETYEEVQEKDLPAAVLKQFSQ